MINQVSISAFSKFSFQTYNNVAKAFFFMLSFLCCIVVPQIEGANNSAGEK